MNADFQTVIAAADTERRDLFLGAAARLGTAVQNVEKDFWVCWTLDALFNGLPAGGPRLLFKGGTSLSKAFGLISRFSEDIDITVFRDDLGQGVEAADLEGLSGKKRRARLNAIRDACQSYIAGPLTTQFTEVAAAAIPGGRFRLAADPDDKDGQTLLFWYPAVTAAEGDYIRAAVKIEAGAKSDLDPHIAATVTPYVTADLPNLDLAVRNVTTVQPERTFWDKVIILHGLRQWYDLPSVRFVIEIIPRRQRLSLLPNLDFSDCEDPSGKARDATEFTFIIGAMESGGVLYNLNLAADISAGVNVVRQAYERVTK